MEDKNNEQKQQNDYHQIIQFWERKKLIYNLITFLGGGLVVFFGVKFPMEFPH